jgi:hypothetical protein
MTAIVCVGCTDSAQTKSNRMEKVITLVLMIGDILTNRLYVLTREEMLMHEWKE